MEKMKHQPWKKREAKSKWRVEKLKFLFSCMDILRNKKNLSWEEIFPQLKSPKLITELVEDHYPSKAINIAKLRLFVKFVNHQQRDHLKLRQELADILIGLGAPKDLAAKYINKVRGALAQSSLTLGSPVADMFNRELMVDGNENEQSDAEPIEAEADDKKVKVEHLQVDKKDLDEED